LPQSIHLQLVNLAVLPSQVQILVCLSMGLEAAPVSLTVSLHATLPQLFWPHIYQQEFQSQQNSAFILNRTLDEFLSASRWYHLDCLKLTQHHDVSKQEASTNRTISRRMTYRCYENHMFSNYIYDLIPVQDFWHSPFDKIAPLACKSLDIVGSQGSNRFCGCQHTDWTFWHKYAASIINAYSAGAWDHTLENDHLARAVHPMKLGQARSTSQW
jgi:hypothetical protein